MLYIVIYKGKKIALSIKSLRINMANKIYVDKLIKTLCFFLLTIIIYLNDFGFFITITNKIVWLDDIINIIFYKILSEKV